jgi:hypothetical protein
MIDTFDALKRKNFERLGQWKVFWPTMQVFSVALVVYLGNILCLDKLLKECERKFEELGRVKLTVAFVTNPFHEKYLWQLLS